MMPEDRGSTLYVLRDMILYGPIARDSSLERGPAKALVASKIGKRRLRYMMARESKIILVQVEDLISESVSISG